MQNIKTRTVILVTKTALFIYEEGKSLLRMDFQPSYYHDLEIISEVEFAKHLLSVIQTNKLTPGSLIVVFGEDAVFDVVLQKSQSNSALTDQERQFIESVPFENVVSRGIEEAKGRHIVAINGDFFLAVRRSFESAGYQFKMLFAVGIIKNQIAALAQPLTAASFQTILSSLDKLRLYDMSVSEAEAVARTTGSKPVAGKVTREHILIVVFVLLLSVLGVVAYQQLQPLPPQKSTPTLTAPTVIPSLVVLPSTATPSATIARRELRLNIIHTAQTASIAATLKTALSNAGFGTVDTTENTSLAGKPIVVFAARVPQTDRAFISTEVGRLLSEPSNQERSDMQYDVIVTLVNQ